MLDALLDAPPSERPELLSTLSRGEASLAAELARLLAQCEQPHPVLDRPVGASFGSVLDDVALPRAIVLVRDRCLVGRARACHRALDGHTLYA